ncbi:exosortase U [Prosthecobacter sp.]|uniref:exosortase U n=1 Tax=Prosthecobacter sp. TaxID=1965333 RepID=UPI003783DED0
MFFALQEIWVRHPACQFFPLPLVTWIWLAARDGMSRAVLFPENPSAFKWLVTGHLLVALVSFVLISPFLAGLAFVLASAALAVAKGTPGRNEAPAWSLPVLSLFFIPPPLMMDQQLHQMLAGLAARLSQGWLDAMHVLHVVQGTIVATPAKRFFVDDACSGTNSLLAAVCVALIISCLNKRSWIHALALLATAGLISVASNVLRICLVIGSSHFWGWELDRGLVHEAVGFVFFMLDLLLVYSADCGWHFFFNSNSDQTAPAMRTQADLPVAAPRLLGSLSLCVAIIGTTLLVGPEVLALLRPAPAALASSKHATPGEFQMPGELSGWVRDGDKPVENSMIGNLGVRNQVWRYRKGGLEAYVAVNFPFLGFHDTRLCYTGQGWQFQKQVDASLPGEGENTVRFLEMTQPTEMARAHLWLSVLDEHGAAQPFKSEKPVDHLTGRLLSRWTSPEPVSTSYVLQIMSVEPENDPSSKDALTALLAGARSRLAEAITNHSPQTGKESE